MKLNDIRREAELGDEFFYDTSRHEFANEQEMLKHITSSLDLSRQLYLINQVLSNQFQSVMILEVLSEELREIYEARYLLRCYRNRIKFFEMPLSKNLNLNFLGAKPTHIDLYQSTVAYILEGESQTFYAIDVGQVIDIRGDENITEGMTEPRQMYHSFEEQVIGFKLGHFIRRDEGLMKAVFWNEEKLYIFPFHPKQSDHEEVEERAIMNNRDYIEINEDWKQICDFGIKQQEFVDYLDEKCEFLLGIDQDNQISLLSGYKYGMEWESFAKFEFEYSLNTEFHALKLINAQKIVGLIEQNEGCHFKIFNIRVGEVDQIQEQKQFDVVDSMRYEARNFFSKSFILDNLNDNLYFPDYSERLKKMIQIPISIDNSSSCNSFIMSVEEAMNCVACHTKLGSLKAQKTNGLLYNDFLVVQNHVVILHGKVVSIFDIGDKRLPPKHLVLDKQDQKNFYDFSLEPKYVWMQDKSVKYTEKRWKIIVYFKNLELKQIKKDGRLNFNLEPYLKADELTEMQIPKLPGEIIKVIRNKNGSNQPIYFTLRRKIDNKVVLGSIGFVRMDYREFEILGLEEGMTKYVILEARDAEMFWQEIACFTTLDDGSGIMDQKLMHIKIRVGGKLLNSQLIDFNTRSGKSEIVVINKQNLPEAMSNIQSATDIFASGHLVYFIQQSTEDIRSPHIDEYDVRTNSYLRTINSETVTRLKVFKNEFFYWRTYLGGSNEDKYESSIYFDGIPNVQNLSQSNTPDFRLFKGNYPHKQKMHWDITSDSLAFFVDFSTIKVVPFLHCSDRKVQIGVDYEGDDQIVAIKHFSPYYIVTLRQSSLIQTWSIITGKFLDQKQLVPTSEMYNFENFQCKVINQQNLRSLKNFR